MLMKSDINPFDSQETKPYKNHAEILAMTNLVRYGANDDEWYGMMNDDMYGMVLV